jgi:hypothetical protein
MKKYHLTLFIVMGIIIGGCTINQRKSASVPMQTTFDYNEHRPYKEKGNNTVTGQGFLRQKGGGVVTCAGSQVFLLPATSYFREAIGHLMQGNDPQVRTIDPVYARVGQCDAQGNFIFSGIPDGGWFVVTEVKWSVGPNLQGGSLFQEINIGGGKTTRVLLSDKNIIGW